MHDTERFPRLALSCFIIHESGPVFSSPTAATPTQLSAPWPPAKKNHSQAASSPLRGSNEGLLNAFNITVRCAATAPRGAITSHDVPGVAILYERVVNQTLHILNEPSPISKINVFLPKDPLPAKIKVSAEGSPACITSRPRSAQPQVSASSNTSPAREMGSPLAKKQRTELVSPHAESNRRSPEKLFWILQSGVINHFTMGRLSVM
jgi:hypothetical protein